MPRGIRNTIYDVLVELVICEPSTLDTGCWEWPRTLAPNGYGIASIDGKRPTVHKLVYEHFKGEVPEGYELDHLCRNRKCANFEHQEPVPHIDNLMRGDTLAARNVAKSHCPQGHPYEGDNLYVYRGKRYCKVCMIERTRQRRKKSK